MNKHSLELVSFPEIVQSMSTYCLSRRGAENAYKTLCSDANIPNEAEQIEELLSLARWFESVLSRTSEWPHLPWLGMDEIWECIAIEGSIADIEQLMLIMKEARALESFIDFVLRSWNTETQLNKYPIVMKLIQEIPTHGNLVRELSRFIDENSGLKEDNIPTLKAARKRVVSLQTESRNAATQLVRQSASLLNGDFATIRDGRTVLPLKSGFKGRIDGIIHAASQSGETLFVEPFELIERNNAIAQAEGEYLREVHIILRNLSSLVRQNAHEYLRLGHKADFFDQAWARARYGRVHEAIFIDDGHELNLRSVKHPLLGKKAVPISVYIPKNKRMLILSGPNTGGKTVSMKTIGLAVLMRQSGIPICATSDSTLPWFENILADIGDEQSIANDLSTFSGHLSRIKECLEFATPNTLVLLDELGSGTDPEEGASLALAISESFLASNCLTLISSHYAALKALGHTEERAMNASMAYSEQLCKPSYEIVPGLPGSSHAIDTAKRINLPARIIERARQILGNHDNPLNELVMRLNIEHAELTALRRKLMAEESAMRLQVEQLKQKEQDLMVLKRELEHNQLGQVSQVLQETRQNAERILRELDARIKLERSYSKPENSDNVNCTHVEFDSALTRKELQEMSQRVKELENSLQEQVPKSTVIFNEGDRIYLPRLKQSGTLVRTNKKNSWEVDVKGKRIIVKTQDLQALNESSSTQVHQSSGKIILANTSHGEYRSNASTQIDIRGMRGAEAMNVLEKKIDEAILVGLGFFSIIHGKGEGILQKMVHEYLSSRSDIKSFSFARPEDGGFGKTNVITS